MKVLAIETSSPLGGVALLDGDDVVERAEIPVSRGRATALFDVLEEVRARAGWAWDEVGLYAAGRGPGRYSGMRVALTAAQALALPQRSPMRAVSSGAALAAALAAGHPDARHIVVVGDARRERVWFGVFDRDGAGVVRNGGWRLAAYGDLGDVLPSGALLASSEWTRLQPHVESAGLSDRDWIRRDVYPEAEWIGRLALAGHRAGTEPEPPTPIYLHPAVAGPAEGSIVS